MPQATGKGVKRRVAHSSAKPPRKRPAAAKPGGSNSSTASKCRSIVAAFSAARELPADVREMLSSLAKQSLSESPHPYQEAAMVVLGKALQDMESRLSNTLEQANKVVRDSDGALAARFQAVNDAEAFVVEQKRAISESKKAMKDAAKAMDAAKETLRSAVSEQKSAEGEKTELVAKKLRLEELEKQAYSPLKEAPACGSNGQKKLKALRKAGKEFLFDDLLLSALPAVLKKVPDRRATFDSLAMQQLETEFMKNITRIEADLTQKETVSQERYTVVQSAQTALKVAQDWHDASKAVLATSEANLASGREALAASKQQARAFESDIQKAQRDIDRIQAELASFRQGPLTAFHELGGLSQPTARKTEVCELVTSGSFQYPFTEIHRRNQEAANGSGVSGDAASQIGEPLPLVVSDATGADASATLDDHADALPEPSGSPRTFGPA